MSDRSTVLASLESALGHRFAAADLLAEALRHRSAAHERGKASSERLEFLGDAALSHAVAAMLFERWPEASEGAMTRARAALVRERTLARLADEIGVPDALDLGGGLERRHPGGSLLADALEAVLGAVLLDGGWRTFRGVVRRLWLPLLEELEPASLPLEEPKSTLQEMAQRRGLPLPVYREVDLKGPAHARIFVFEVEVDGRTAGRGEGSSKRAAQQDAARDALNRVDNGGVPGAPATPPATERHET
jgi:ribonuclease-3